MNSTATPISSSVATEKIISLKKKKKLFFFLLSKYFFLSFFYLQIVVRNILNLLIMRVALFILKAIQKLYYNLFNKVKLLNSHFSSYKLDNDT